MAIIAAVAIVARVAIIPRVIGTIRVVVGIVRIVVSVRAPPRAISIVVRVSPIWAETKAESVAVTRETKSTKEGTSAKPAKASAIKTVEASTVKATKASAAVEPSGSAAKSTKISAAVKSAASPVKASASAVSATLGRSGLRNAGQHDGHRDQNKNS